MSLSYQPFAETPELENLSDELHMNLPDSARAASALGGAALIAAAVPVQSRSLRMLIATLGLAFLYRGVSGRCPWYESRGIDRRHSSSGVPGDTGSKIEHSIEIHRSPQVLYDFWHNLEQLPRVMRHVESVHRMSDRRSQWKVRGPLGKTIEWEAEIINDVPSTLIAWQSLPGCTVRNAGSVWFEPNGNGGTRLKVALEFDPPGGAVGTSLSALLGRSPQRDLEEDLSNFKEFAERELEPFLA
jgi:uncharacterized membrane protein